MRHHDEEVNPCTTLGHTYLSAVVTWCPHVGAHLVTVNLWHDTDRDEPMVLHGATFEAGPFDSPTDVHAELLEMLNTAWLELLARHDSPLAT